MEVVGFISQILLISFSIIIILHTPLWFVAKKKQIFSKVDYIFPFLMIPFWMFVSSFFEMIDIAPKSISNLAIELVIIIFLTFFGCGIKIFISSSRNSLKRNNYIFCGVITMSVILIALFTPLIPE